MNDELERLRAEAARLRAEIERRDAEMDEERRAMMFMLDDTNRSAEEMERASAWLRAEMEVTTHLLMIAEASANTTDVARLMKEVIHCVQKVLGCGICLIYNWDAAAKTFTPAQESGLPRETVPQFMTENLDADVALVKRVLGGKEPVAVARDIDDLMRIAGDGRKEVVFSWLPFGDTIAGILLTGKTGHLGLILAVFKQEKEFTERDRRVVKGVSNQVSVALEQARLYRESTDRGMDLSHKIETIHAMHEIDKSILSLMDPQEIIETAIRMMSRIVPCDAIAVLLTDKEKGGFSYAAGFGLALLSKGAFISFEETIATDVVTTGRLQYIINLKELAETQHVASLPSLEEDFLREGFLSQIMLPLIVKQEIAGVLAVESRSAAAFTPQGLSTLEKTASQIGIALQNARQLKDLEELFIGTVKSLSSAIDAKSKWTAGHSERVTAYALQIGKEMGLPENELRDLELAGLLHDIGKIGTYEAILDKPDKLTEEEFEIVKKHPIKGAEILAPIRQLKDIIPAIRHHHEFYDGNGYPDGLKGEAIPLSARIIGVADAVDAMGADRPYRKGRPMEAIIAELKRCSGAQFDPEVVEAFLSISQGSKFMEK